MNFAAYLDWLVESAHTVGRRASAVRVMARHPGAVLEAEYLEPRGISQSELARRAQTTHAKINEIVNGKRGISAAFALTLEDVLGTPAAMWMSLQAEWDLAEARRKRA